jgi:hypothetical protein
MTPIPPPETFTAHELFDPFGIRRHGEMKVVLLADHELRIAKLTAEVERLKEQHAYFLSLYEPQHKQALEERDEARAENARLKATQSALIG